MITRKNSIRIVLAAAGLLFVAPGARSAPLNVAVTPTQEGVTPAVLGYNASHFLPGTNAPDWWRYTGAKAARVLRGPSLTDVVHPYVDLATAKAGVDTDTFEKFMQRRAALRANAENPDQPLDNSFIDWPWFMTRFESTLQAVSGQRFYTTPLFTELRRQGVDILVQMTAGGSGFEIANDDDWAAKWLVWRYYYTHAFLMSRDFDVVRYSMYNEPNIGDTPTYEQWHRLLLIASDAIQGAIADVNTRYGKNLKPEIFAPHCTSPYDWEPNFPSPNSPVSPKVWAVNAVNDRHKRFDGTIDPNWRNFHFFNHQRYGLDPEVNYAQLIAGIRDLITPLTDGETPYGIGLTEFNTTDIATSRRNTETADQPKHYSSFGGTLVALTRADARQLYLFLFGQTIQVDDTVTNPVYPVRKNGTHYVSDAAGGYNYGGATQVAEVYRLFLKAAQGALPRFVCTGDPLPADLHLLVTRDDSAGMVHVFASNRAAEEHSLNLDLSAFGLPEGNLFIIEEVSDRSNGGVVARATVTAGGIGELTLRPQSVALVSISTRPQAPMPGGTTTLVVPAIADTQLADGAAKNTPGGGGAVVVARSDGLTADGRRVALLKFRVPAIAPADMQVVLLDLFAAATGGTARIQAHVYGLDDDNWDEATVTWASLTSALKQGVPAGNKIANNVVINQEGGPASILGQLVATTDTLAETLVNVTDFVRRQDDGYASFLIVQDHRMEWTLDPDIAPVFPNQPNHIPGDTQLGGIRIVTREGATGGIHGPRLLVAASSAPTGPALIGQPVGAAVDEGAPATLSVTTLEIGADVTYQWRKDGVPIPGETGPTLMLPGALTDAGFYDVVVSNQTGSTTSDEVIVVVRPAAAGSLFGEVAAVAVDRDNNLYVADAAQHIIQVITPDNYARVFAGVSGSSGKLDGVGAAALFNAPGALAVRGGNLYVADTGNSTIRAISPDARVITLAGLAGSGTHADGRGTGARFDHPGGIVAAATGSGTDIVLYVADTGNHVIRKIAPGLPSGSDPVGAAGPLVTTLAGGPRQEGALDGTGTNARFRSPVGIAATGTGADTVLYVADTGNHAIRKIIAATGEVTTLAGALGQEGSADATGTAARFRSPRGLLVDGTGEIYVADTGNSTIRLIAGGTVTTVAGLPGTDTVPGLAGLKDGQGESAWFDHPAALALGENGKLYVADTGNRALRVVDEHDNVTTLPVRDGSVPSPVPPGEGGGSTSAGGGGGAPSAWFAAALAMLLCLGKRRKF
ncbi:hypothetical protein OH491_17795 [Termitidicoccus mucosus]|uniref:Ig-like domain-containing protein n=1 Tax=Termitidicoccus mucosus TaxID=1184151 RepID=A0A178IIU2_9BACT|nr:hypothetical protein AW736_10815 [Opitutaceae bacterium TSB47]